MCRGGAPVGVALPASVQGRDRLTLPRSFRTWHRARSLLYYVRQNSNLTDIALDAGYPDSTHFSHSIRQVYGLTPKSIIAGCRDLALFASRVGASRYGYR